jgi:hypothetical protein
VIPVLRQRGSDIPLHFEQRNYRDLSGSGYALGFQELLEDIGGRKGVELKEWYRYTYVTARRGSNSRPVAPHATARPNSTPQ